MHPICTRCGTSVVVPQGQDPDEKMAEHLETECNTDPDDSIGFAMNESMPVASGSRSPLPSVLPVVPSRSVPSVLATRRSSRNLKAGASESGTARKAKKTKPASIPHVTATGAAAAAAASTPFNALAGFPRASSRRDSTSGATTPNSTSPALSSASPTNSGFSLHGARGFSRNLNSSMSGPRPGSTPPADSHSPRPIGGGPAGNTRGRRSAMDRDNSDAESATSAVGLSNYLSQAGGYSSNPAPAVFVGTSNPQDGDQPPPLNRGLSDFSAVSGMSGGLRLTTPNNMGASNTPLSLSGLSARRLTRSSSARSQLNQKQGSLFDLLDVDPAELSLPLMSPQSPAYSIPMVPSPMQLTTPQGGPMMSGLTPLSPLGGQAGTMAQFSPSNNNPSVRTPTPSALAARAVRDATATPEDQAHMLLALGQGQTPRLASPGNNSGSMNMSFLLPPTYFKNANGAGGSDGSVLPSTMRMKATDSDAESVDGEHHARPLSHEDSNGSSININPSAPDLGRASRRSNKRLIQKDEHGEVVSDSTPSGGRRLTRSSSNHGLAVLVGPDANSVASASSSGPSGESAAPPSSKKSRKRATIPSSLQPILVPEVTKPTPAEEKPLKRSKKSGKQAEVVQAPVQAPQDQGILRQGQYSAFFNRSQFDQMQNNLLLSSQPPASSLSVPSTANSSSGPSIGALQQLQQSKPQGPIAANSNANNNTPASFARSFPFASATPSKPASNNASAPLGALLPHPHAAKPAAPRPALPEHHVLKVPPDHEKELAEKFAMLSELYVRRRQAFTNEGGRTEESKRFLRGFIAYFCLQDRHAQAKDPKPPFHLDHFDPELIASVSALVDSILPSVQSVADYMLMNDLEIAVWSIFVDRLEPRWLRLGQHQRNALIHSAYTVKTLFDEHHLIFIPYLNSVIPQFGEVYQQWLASKPGLSLAVPPMALNERFSLFLRFRS